MTLIGMLAAHDPATLESMSPKGLLRRATKQAKADDALVESCDVEKAVVLTEGHTISIDSAGPTKANCSCPAPGICRHILTAVLLLQDHSESGKSESEDSVDEGKSKPNEEPPEPPELLTTALESISQLSSEQLKKFAGADWAEANQLAAKLIDEVQKPEIISQGLNSVVKLDDGLYSVTFIAGSILKEAVFKGPKTKKRLITATCALILRNSTGIPLESNDALDESGNSAKGLTSAYLSEAQLVLENAAITVLNGAADIAAEQLFDLAISARVQAAPRLSSQLRSLSKMALKAKDHAIDFHANDFLVLLSRSYALVRALQVTPDNPKLTGSLRRDYTVTEPLTVWVLGAKHWTTPSGARGITTYAYSEAQQAWYSSSIARAAGMQLDFDPYYAYEEALWGASSMSSLSGQCVELVQPRISSDRQIAQEKTAAIITDKQSLTSDFIQHSSCIIDDWDVLTNRVQVGFGEGLTRGVLPIAQLLKPKRFGALSFDEFSQKYYWEIADIKGQIISLELSEVYSRQIDELRQVESKIEAILIEAVLINDKLHFHPVSLLVEQKKALEVRNLQFHRPGHQNRMAKLLKRFKDIVIPTKKTEAIIPDALEELANACIDWVVDFIAYPNGQADPLEGLLRRCEATGLTSLAGSMRLIKKSQQPEHFLAVVYIASEVSITASLEKNA